MAEEQERGALHGVERFIGGRREPDVLGQPAHVRIGQLRGDPGRRILVGGVVEHEHRQRRVVLGGEGRQGGLEPRSGARGDHDRHDRRRGDIGLGGLGGNVGERLEHGLGYRLGRARKVRKGVEIARIRPGGTARRLGGLHCLHAAGRH